MNETTHLYKFPRHPTLTSPRRYQSGVVLVIALIVLVAMTLAGIGLMRAVDTNTAMAGNLAFRQSAVQAADVALKQSLTWIVNNSGSGGLNAANGAGYFAAEGTAIPTGPNGEELFEQFDWTNLAAHIAADPATQNRFDFIVERQCAAAGSVDAFNTHCALTEITTSAGNCTGCSYIIGAGSGLNIGQPQYRVTVRITGPRNTVSYVQSNQY